MRRRTLLLSLLLALPAAAAAADGGGSDDHEIDADRLPSFQTGGNLFIHGATLLTVSDGTIEEGDLVVRDGRIAALGRGLTAPADCHVLDGSGLFVMPGIIDCHAHIAIEGGINEGSQSVVPEVLILDEVNHRDLSIYRALAGGTTAANLLHGSANVIGGQNAVIKLRWGASASQMLFEGAPRGVKFALGENPKRSNSRSRQGPRRYPSSRPGVETVLRRSFTAAENYREEWRRHRAAVARGEPAVPPRRDLRLEALVDILEGRILVHSHCYRADEILMLLRVAEDHGFRIATLQHVLEGYKVAPEIAAHGAGGSTFADWWAYKLEAYDAIPYNAALMTRAGVKVSINSDSGDFIRRLYHEAAKCLRYGNLGEQDTLALITLNPALQLGIEERVGSLEVGKDADLALFNGHPLSVYSRCEYTFIDGECYFERGRERQDNRTGPRFGPRDCPLPSHLPLPGAGGVYALRGGTVHPVCSAPIEDGTVLIRDGRIAAVGREVSIPADAEVIDVDGLSIYPGLIDGASRIGLGEIGSVAGSNDTRELGEWQPDLRILSSVHPDSSHIPVARCDGVTAAVVLADGATIAGQAAAVHLDGWTWEELEARDGLALVVLFPSVDDEDSLEDALDKKEVRELAQRLEEARRYGAARRAAAERGLRLPDVDRKLEALEPFARGEKRVLLRARNKNQIRAAVTFAEKEGLDYALLGVADGWLVADFLAEHDVPCLVGPVLTTPRRATDRYDAPFQNPARLHAAGVRFALVSLDQSNVRRLGHHAGMAAAFGLPREEALASVTLRPAQILGLEDELGSLEEGKIANVIVTDGDPLELRTHVRYEFIRGRPIPLQSKHTELYERYLGRVREQRPAAAPATALPAGAASSSKR